jgi:hypothetical protein
MTEWRDIPGYGGQYQVSDDGQVKSFKCGGERILRPRPDGDYVSVRLYGAGAPRNHAIHRLVLECFVSPCPDGQEGCHNNGDARDNRLTNLRWDTRVENQLDNVRHGKNRNAAKERCHQGHHYTSENTYTNAVGWRQCRTCIRARNTDARDHINDLKRARRAKAKLGVAA